jgi:3-hydroxymyristoyl/3-hydroxydecanoyl-(acyl carrier protein) dehydratase
MSNTSVGHFVVPADHPSLAGHFPGNPIVPAVVLLDRVLAAIQAQRPCTLQSIPGVKFLQPVRPDERIDLHIEFAADMPITLRARFKALRGTSAVCEGTFVLSISSEAAT